MPYGIYVAAMGKSTKNLIIELNLCVTTDCCGQEGGSWIRFFGNESVISKNGRGDLLKFNNELCAALHNVFNVLSE